MPKDIGIIGVGAMGSAMATRFIEAGHSLTVFDIDKEAMVKLEQKGAKSVASPKAVAEKSDVVFTMLPDSPDVEAAILGEEGVLAGARSGSVIIDTSTDSPSTSKKIAKEAKTKNVDFLGAGVDAPPWMVASGGTRIFVGGEEEVFGKCKDIFDILASEGGYVVYMGDIGTGEAIKLVNNLMFAINMVGIAEGFSLGVKLGVKPQVLFDLISEAGGGSWALQNKVKDTVLKGEYEPAFRLDLMLKDNKIALEEARDLRVPMPVLSLAQEMYIAASAAGMGPKDVSAVASLYEQMAKVKLSTGASP